MPPSDRHATANIRRFLADDYGANDNAARDGILKEFSCGRNPEVERFLKEQSVSFTLKHQSVTYLVFSRPYWRLSAYFTLTIKPITIDSDKFDLFSKVMQKKIKRMTRLDEGTNAYSLSAYLIAQLGKNFHDGAEKLISGAELLNLAFSTIKKAQYLVGGMAVFVETANERKLLDFYERNNFREFATRQTAPARGEPSDLVQLLAVL